MCHDDEPADGDYATGESDVCGNEVTGLVISYFDGLTWLDQWDAREASPNQETQLPKAVFLTLTLGKTKPEQFETVIYIPTS
jgi:hypothetical protein